MKRSEAVISIHSEFGYDQPESESVEFTTDGFYSYEGDSCSMGYFETEVTGMPGTFTSFLVSPEEIMVDRKGSITSSMMFKEGLKDTVMYQTPYGYARMGINTRKIKSSIAPDRAEIEIDYVVNMEHVVAMRNRFTISVEKQEDTQQWPI